MDDSLIRITQMRLSTWNGHSQIAIRISYGNASNSYRQITNIVRI